MERPSNKSGIIWNAVGLDPLNSISLVVQPYPHKPQTPQRGPRFQAWLHPLRLACLRGSSHTRRNKKKRGKTRTRDLPDQKWAHKPILVPFQLENGSTVKMLEFFRYNLTARKFSIPQTFSEDLRRPFLSRRSPHINRRENSNPAQNFLEEFSAMLSQ